MKELVLGEQERPGPGAWLERGWWAGGGPRDALQQHGMGSFCSWCELR